MTVKELAKFTGKNESTVTRWIKKAQMQNADAQLQFALTKGHEKDFTIEEVEVILQNSSMSKDAVAILMENAKSEKIPSVKETGLVSTQIDRDYKIAMTNIANLLVRFSEEVISVNNNVKAIDSRLSAIESKIQERKALLPAPDMSPRAHINMLVRDYAIKNSIEYREVWRELYKNFGYRTNTNPAISAKNRGMNIIDFIDSEGQLETLESVAIELFAA